MSYPLKLIDFERVKECFDAYWRREIPGRPLVGITCPRQDARPPEFPVPDTVERRWTDIEYQCSRARWQMENTVYLGEALPVFTPNLGPDSFSAFLGAELRFLDEHTSWVRPCVDDLAEYTPLFDRSNKWWRHMCELVDAVCEAAEGRFLVGVPDLHGGGDALAALRHSDRFALDLYDKPDHVKRVMPGLTAIYKEVFADYASRISRVQDGCTTWLRAYSRGTYTALQNDFSGLISPDMFVEFFLPEVRELSGYLDNSLYHLDGPIALGNLPHLLEIVELDGIQWVRGAGSKPMSQWGDVCRQVLDAGKCLHIECAPEELDHLLRTLPHEGLFVDTGCPNESEGRKLLRHVEDEFGRPR
jgi:5-methyltetrahydrofolate--homocysteine methyltransferase